MSWALLAVACQPLPSISVSLGPDEVGTTDILVAHVSEDSGDALRRSYAYSYSWFNNEEEVVDLTENFVPAEFTTKGESWQVIVTPEWGDRSGVAAASNELVIGNSAPEILVSLAPEMPGSHEEVMASIDDRDPDGEVLNHTFVWTRQDNADDPGTIMESLTEGVLPSTETSMGEIWTVTVTPNDGIQDGVSVSDSVEIGNGAPTVVAIDLSPEDAYEGDILVATIDVEDAEGDPVTNTYQWFVNDEPVVGALDVQLSSDYFAKGDEVTLEVTPSDSELVGIPVRSEARVILNTAPSMTDVQIDPAVVFEGSSVLCQPVGWFDPDGDAEMVSVTWWVNGVEVSSGDTIDGSLYDKDDDIQCLASPDDGTDQGVAVWSAEVTVSNTPPNLASSSILPATPTTVDDLSSDMSTATDDDGDSVSPWVTWYINSAKALVSPTLPASYIERGDEVYAEVAGFDGEDLGVAVTTSTLTVSNSSPVVSSVSIRNTNLYTNDEAEVDVVVTDNDGDSVTLAYDWAVNGVSTGETGATLDGAVWFDKLDTVSVTVTPSDPFGAGSTATSAAVTVENTAPTGQAIGVTPERPVEDVHDLLCEIESDAVDVDDGDTVNYTVTWTVNSIAFGGATTTTLSGDTIPASDIAGGDSWECTVVADDGTDFGDSVSATVSVSEPWEEVAAGRGHSCGLYVSGAPECWGLNTSGQATPPSAVFDQIDAGGFHSCGISSGAIQCWGLDGDGQCSDAPGTGSYTAVRLGLKHGCALDTSDNLACWGRDLNGSTSPPSGTYAAFDVGEYHACALDTSGSASCWGGDSYGESTPSTTTTYSAIATGGNHSCGIVSSTGALDCWGRNSKGETSPTSGTGFVDLSCGRYHCCAIGSSGSLSCWGDNTYGQSTPPTGAFDGISSGRYHTCGWTAAGYAECWGDDSDNQSTIP